MKFRNLNRFIIKRTRGYVTINARCIGLEYSYGDKTLAILSNRYQAICQFDEDNNIQTIQLRTDYKLIINQLFIDVIDNVYTPFKYTKTFTKRYTKFSYTHYSYIYYIRNNIIYEFTYYIDVPDKYYLTQEYSCHHDGTKYITKHYKSHLIDCRKD